LVAAYLPGVAADGLTQASQAGVRLLSPWQGGLAFTAWAAAIAAAGTVVTARRDITGSGTKIVTRWSTVTVSWGRGDRDSVTGRSWVRPLREDRVRPRTDHHERPRGSLCSIPWQVRKPAASICFSRI
jgi:hypothetical protein